MPAKKFLFATAACWVLAGCGGGSGIGVTVAVGDFALRKPGSSCSGSGGYLWIHRGTAYVLSDAAGKELARGELPSGTARRVQDPIAGAAVEPTACVMSFSVRAPTRRRYVVRLSGSGRDVVRRPSLRGDALTVRVP